MLERIKKDLKCAYRHKVDRLNHVYGVRDTALKLGKIHGADLYQLELVSYLHDLTKYESLGFHIEWIRRYYDEAILDDFYDPLYHAYSASAIAQDTYNITDPDVLGAIEVHTVGKPNMSLLQKILFISDYIEPSRLYPSCVRVREIAFINLDQAVYEAINDSIQLYERTGGNIPRVAYEAREYYQKRTGGHACPK